MRNFVSGAFVASLFSVGVLATLSLMGEQPAGRLPPSAPQQEVASATPSDAAASSLPQPPAEVAPVGADPLAQTPPEAAPSGSDAPLNPEVQAAAAVPQAAAVETGIASPGGSASAIPQTEELSPVLPNPQSVAPQPPAAESGPEVSTETATPGAQDTAAPDLAEPAAPADANAPAASAEAGGPIADQGPSLAPPPAEDNAPGAGTEAVAAAPVLVELQGSSASMPGGNSGVTIRRPATEATASTAAPGADPGDAPATVQGDDRPALERYAAGYDNPEDLPLISVLLVDDGSMPQAVVAVLSTGVPVTVVIDAGLEDAAERMAQYRVAGIEVAAMSRLPHAARPADAEVTMAATFATLPQTVALVDLGQSGLQADRQVTDQVMSILSDTGRGFVTLSSGLNLAVRSAEQAEVAHAVVYRDLDNLDQDSRAIRRFLDQAAFRARQDGAVVMLGRVRPDTISALVLWGTANRASQVMIAPLSALLGRANG